MFGILNTIASSVFGGLGMGDLIKYAVRISLMVAMLAMVATFVNKVVGFLPSTDISGCAGHYASAWGLIDGFRLMLSIVVYGFLFKTAYSHISKII